MARRWLVRFAPFLILTLFMVPALVPLLQPGELPCTHDDIWHTFRIVAMREMLRHGWLFSRWVPNLALGYGYPFFNYREPLPYLAGTALFAAGLPLSLIQGLLYVVSLIAGAWGGFVLGRELFGRRAGWVAGLAYGLAPYVLLDALRRGNMPESVALALLPWIFIAVRRLVLGRGRGAFAATAALLVALFLSHNISSLLLAPFLGSYVLLLAWVHRDRRAWPYAFAAVAVAVLLAAWFWLPALAEREWVQLHLSRTTRNNDFRYNFVTWGEMLLTLPAPYDPSFLNPPMRIYLGIGHGILAMIGAVVGLWRAPCHKRDEAPGGRDEQRLLVGLFVLVAAGYLWMATPGALGIWERLPLLAYVQFPWRLVGRALLPASLLAGLAAEAWPRVLSVEWRRLKGWVPSAVVAVVAVLLTLLAWPDAYPPLGSCPAERYPDLEDLYALESAGWMGMDPESSYFPIWVERHPTDLTLAEAFTRGELPQRLDASVLPEGTRVVRADYRPLDATLVISAPEAFQARWLGLYFPGWTVQVDGQAVAVTPEAGTGMLTFDVPAGERRITVRFGDTATRRLGMALSIAGVVLGTGFFLVPYRALDDEPRICTLSQGLMGRADGSALRRAGTPRVSQVDRLVAVLAAVALGLLAVRYLVVARIPTPVHRPRVRNSSTVEVATPLSTPLPFEGGLSLLGYSLESESVLGDAEFQVDLLWQARAAPGMTYRTLALLRGPDGQSWSPAGTARPRGYEPPPPTEAWQPGAYVYDPHIVMALPGTPPGQYTVIAAAFDADTLVPASVLDAAGQPVGPDWQIGTVEIAAPHQPPALALLGVPPGESGVVCDPLRLWTMALDRAISAPGDIVALRWVWEAVERPTADLTATLALLNPAGEVVRDWTLPPAADWWPTGRWSEGDRWVGRHVLRLPGDLASGDHQLQVRLEGCTLPLSEAPLTVVAPERVWTVPAELVPVEVTFGDRITLAGFEVLPEAPTTGASLEIRLAWQAQVPIETSYRVFLHLLGPDGAIVAQQDGEPVAWARPTTGWAVGEVVTETRMVTIPADAVGGAYELRVGLYEPGGPRLLTGTGEDGHRLTTVQIDG